MGPSFTDDELTVLMVGNGEPLSEALIAAMERHGLSVEAVASVGSTQAAIAVAPDLILLVGDATESGGTDILGQLSASTLAAVIPVVLLADDETLADRLRAFRFGATAVVPRTASADAIAVRITELANEIPERSNQVKGELGEATLDEFASMLTRELRNGILSVKGDTNDETIRIVLGEGKQLAEVVEGFVSKVRPLVHEAEVVHYEFHEHATGTLSFLGPDLDTDEEDNAGVTGLRILLADDDVARADGVAQELRARGAEVVMTDLAGTRLRRARTFDPSVLVIDDKAVTGSGYELVRRMREDTRLRWAFLLVVSWDEIWSVEDRGPVVSSLVSRLARLGEAESQLRELAIEGKPFDARLEVIGAARLLRALVDAGKRLRVTVHNRRGPVRIDVSEGLIAGAVFEAKAEQTIRLEGPVALAGLLGMATGRVRVEPVDAPETTNIMATIDVALEQADGEDAPFRPSEAPARTSAAPEELKLVGSTRLTPTLAGRRDATLQALVAPPVPHDDLTGELKAPPGSSAAPQKKSKKPPMPPPPAKGARQRFVPAPPPKLTLSQLKRPDEAPPADDSPLAPIEEVATEVAHVPSQPKKKRRRQPTLVGMPMPGTGSLPAPAVTKDTDLPVLVGEETTREVPGSSLDDSATDQVDLPPDLPDERTKEVAMPAARPEPPAPLSAMVDPEPAKVPAIEPSSLPAVAPAIAPPAPAVDPLGVTIGPSDLAISSPPPPVGNAPIEIEPAHANGFEAPAVMPEAFDAQPLPATSTHVSPTARSKKSHKFLYIALAALGTMLIGGLLGVWVLLSQPDEVETVTQLGTGTGTETGTGTGTGTGTETGTGYGTGME